MKYFLPNFIINFFFQLYIDEILAKKPTLVTREVISKSIKVKIIKKKKLKIKFFFCISVIKFDSKLLVNVL